MRSKKNLLYEELSYEMLGCAYEAFKSVGVGFDELVYHRVFHDFLLRKGMNARYKVPLHVDYLGERIADLEADEILEDRIVVELKCIQTAFIPENYAQLMTYLKITKLRLGFLINFGLHKAYPQRIIFDEKRRPNFEGWDDGFFQHTSMGNPFDSTIASLRNIDQALGPAYHSKIYQAALSTELKHNRIIFDNKVCIPLEVGNRQFKPFEIDYWLVEQAFLLGVLAGKDRPRAWDLLRMRSYLHRLNSRHGLIAYWSTNNFQLYGIYQR